ncbi:hypothetical protein DFH09DRAFT_1185465 [Mycena vulgaris]|nr:hypothetical protein DFH09DRAFT_1185465 [Mycena vulgaris]
MRPIHSLITGVLLPVLHGVSAQTLYEVSVDPGPSATQILDISRTISAAGVGADGWTTYVEKDVETSLVVERPFTTVTFISVPTTYTFTFEGDASGFRDAIPGPLTSDTSFATCAFVKGRTGSCVDSIVRDGSSTILLETLTGSVVPFYTLAPSAARRTAMSAGLLVLSATILVVGALSQFF